MFFAYTLAGSFKDRRSRWPKSSPAFRESCKSSWNQYLTDKSRSGQGKDGGGGRKMVSVAKRSHQLSRYPKHHTSARNTLC